MTTNAEILSNFAIGDELRVQAESCRQLAGLARTERNRIVWLRFAEEWLELASSADLTVLRNVIAPPAICERVRFLGRDCRTASAIKTAYNPMRTRGGYRDIIGSRNRMTTGWILIELVPVRRAHTMHITFGTGQIWR
jgi:hypothetical protein